MSKSKHYEPQNDFDRWLTSEFGGIHITLKRYFLFFIAIIGISGGVGIAVVTGVVTFSNKFGVVQNTVERVGKDVAMNMKNINALDRKVVAVKSDLKNHVFYTGNKNDGNKGNFQQKLPILIGGVDD